MASAVTDEALRDEIERLSAANRAAPNRENERRLLQLRHRAGIVALDAKAGTPAHPEPDTRALGDPGDELPEFQPGELTPELLRAAILRDGCLLVRGLVERERAEAFAELIDRSFEERLRGAAGEPMTEGYYEEFTPDPERYKLELREWIQQGGGVLAVDSPLLSFEMLEMFRDAGIPELVRGYLGETPLISTNKTTLRKAEPSGGGAWHQDGKFMGRVHSLNLWLSLSHCGDDAPGLDLVPKRFDDFVTVETDEAAWFPNMVSQAMAERVAGDTPIVRPIFEPGDALLFDDLFLHKTGSDESMPNPRYAIENWFFGASGFPEAYAPIAI